MVDVKNNTWKCIAVVRTISYNEEKAMHDKGALPLCQSQQIYM